MCNLKSILWNKQQGNNIVIFLSSEFLKFLPLALIRSVNEMSLELALIRFVNEMSLELEFILTFWRYFYQISYNETLTSEEFVKCRLDNFSMSFILYYVNFNICENKWIAMNVREQF